MEAVALSAVPPPASQSASARRARRASFGFLVPRNRSDVRTVIWGWLLLPSVPILGLSFPRLAPWLLPLALYTSYCSAVLTHNHVHARVFRSRLDNDLYGMLLSVFWGSPIAFWLPTHVEHHHRYVDGPEEATRTRRRSPNHNLWQAVLYTFSCVVWEWPLLVEYVKRVRSRRSRAWANLRNQFLAVLFAHTGAMAVAIALYGPGRGLLTYALVLGLPSTLAPLFMLFTNYLQHVHCDPSSPDNHSRNFISPALNWLLFNNGYHTVHHDRPSAHWTQYQALHKQRAPSIHPSLMVHSMQTFCVTSYLLGPFFPRFRTRSLLKTT